jgi:hypothetical protein
MISAQNPASFSENPMIEVVKVSSLMPPPAARRK